MMPSAGQRWLRALKNLSPWLALLFMLTLGALLW